MKKWSTGALVATGLAAWIFGLGMGGRIVARAYEDQYGPLRNGQRRALPPMRR